MAGKSVEVGTSDLQKTQYAGIGLSRGVKMTVSEDEWAELNKQYIIAKDLGIKDVLDMIRQITKENEMSIQAGQGYSYALPQRADSQVEYVASLKQLCLRRGKENKFSFGDPKTGRHALIISAILSIVQEALLDNIPIDSRFLYYRDVNMFQDQETSNEALFDVCCLLGVSRHCLNVFASPKGIFTGPISLRMNGLLGAYDITCHMSSMEGCMVPIMPGNISDIVYTGEKHKAISFILVVEKKALFHYLVRRGFHIRFNCILITGSGQPDTSTRSLVSRLCAKFKDIPAYAFVDPDPHGILIFCTYKLGSKNLSFDNFGLATDRLEWIGSSPEEIAEKNPQSQRPLNAEDTHSETSIGRQVR